MTTVVSPLTHSQRALEHQLDNVSAGSAINWSAYAELAKPRIALMVLISMAVGYVLASRGSWDLLPLVHASIGVFLAVVSSSALNQYIERQTDARMPRTQNRPLPMQRLTPRGVLLFATGCGLLSFAYLWFAVNPLTAWLGLLSIVLYAGVYTPMKRWTTFCTAVGAVPGALPPVLGWTAAGGELSWGAFSLFAILFVWQFPHFLAIAWMYRDQYDLAGLKMVPGRGRRGVIGSVALAYALVLIPVSLLPAQLSLSGEAYSLCAVALGVMYAWSAFRFLQDESRLRARQLLWASLVYLPSLLLALMLDHVRLMQ